MDHGTWKRSLEWSFWRPTDIPRLKLTGSISRHGRSPTGLSTPLESPGGENRKNMFRPTRVRRILAPKSIVKVPTVGTDTGGRVTENLLSPGKDSGTSVTGYFQYEGTDSREGQERTTPNSLIWEGGWRGPHPQYTTVVTTTEWERV